MRLYEDIPAAELAETLLTLGRHARKLLEECVEKQEVTRRKASKAAESLYEAGFLFIRDVPDFFEPTVILRPSLLGEEALDLLEQVEEKTTSPALR